MTGALEVSYSVPITFHFLRRKRRISLFRCIFRRTDKRDAVKC